MSFVQWVNFNHSWFICPNIRGHVKWLQIRSACCVSSISLAPDKRIYWNPTCCHARIVASVTHNIYSSRGLEDNCLVVIFDASLNAGLFPNVFCVHQKFTGQPVSEFFVLLLLCLLTKEQLAIDPLSIHLFSRTMIHQQILQIAYRVSLAIYTANRLPWPHQTIGHPNTRYLITGVQGSLLERLHFLRLDSLAKHQLKRLKTSVSRTTSGIRSTDLLLVNWSA